MQGISPPHTDVPSNSELHVLAQLSPVGGVESIAFVVASISIVGGALFASSLHPLLGGIGSSLAIISVACVAERVLRPLVLCELGRHVFKTLVNISGQCTATEVARLCGERGVPSPEQLRVLMIRAQGAHVPGAGERI